MLLSYGVFDVELSMLNESFLQTLELLDEDDRLLCGDLLMLLLLAPFGLVLTMEGFFLMLLVELSDATVDVDVEVDVDASLIDLLAYEPETMDPVPLLALRFEPADAAPTEFIVVVDSVLESELLSKR